MKRQRVSTDSGMRAAFAEAMLVVAAVSLPGCGGSEKNPVDTPPSVINDGGLPGQRLSFAYFQRCVNPILVAPLQFVQGGVVVTSTCAASGCHDDATGTGGAFRLRPAAQPVDVLNPANTVDVIRASEIYRNFYSAQAQAIAGLPAGSPIYTKPLLLNTAHRGGRNLLDELDANARRIQYWINNPAPAGQDEFSPATYAMFTPANPNFGSCNTQ